MSRPSATFRSRLQLLFWWGLLREAAPAPRQAWQPLARTSSSAIAASCSRCRSRGSGPSVDGGRLRARARHRLCAVCRWARRRQERRPAGNSRPAGSGSAWRSGCRLPSFLAQRRAARTRMAGLRGFNFTGGTAVSPEFGALLIGLVDLHRQLHRARSSAPAFSRSAGARARRRWRSGSRGGQRMRLVVSAAGAAGHRPADDQRVSEPDQEQLARGDHRLSRPRLDRQHDDEPDRPGGRGDRDDHGGLSGDQPADLSCS